jgi:hypothetical protein
MTANLASLQQYELLKQRQTNRILQMKVNIN